MTKATSHLPAGYHSVTPYLIVNGAAKAIDMYQKVFGATEVLRMGAPDGKIHHCELKIGNSHIMIADEFPEMGHKSPKSLGGSGVGILIYVENVDAIADRAITAGMKVIRPVKDQFYGDRMGSFEDPFGHQWSIGTHIEDLTPEEISERAKNANPN